MYVGRCIVENEDGRVAYTAYNNTRQTDLSPGKTGCMSSPNLWVILTCPHVEIPFSFSFSLLINSL